MVHKKLAAWLLVFCLLISSTSVIAQSRTEHQIILEERQVPAQENSAQGSPVQVNPSLRINPAQEQMQQVELQRLQQEKSKQIREQQVLLQRHQNQLRKELQETRRLIDSLRKKPEVITEEKLRDIRELVKLVQNSRSLIDHTNGDIQRQVNAINQNLRSENGSQTIEALNQIIRTQEIRIQATNRLQTDIATLLRLLK